jgi:hypothetical protein
MGELAADIERQWDAFGRLHISPLLLIVLRTVHEPALAFDLATEALAALRTRYGTPPNADQALSDLIDCAADQLSRAAEIGRVPTVERRRRGRTAPHRLTATQQQELARLAEQHLGLPENARDAADALARSAPSMEVLTHIALSGLVEAERLFRTDIDQNRVDHESA